MNLVSVTETDIKFKHKQLLKQVVTILQTISLAFQKSHVDDASTKLVTLAAACCSSSQAC